jgi:hypothetical protein
MKTRGNSLFGPRFRVTLAVLGPECGRENITLVNSFSIFSGIFLPFPQLLTMIKNWSGGV